MVGEGRGGDGRTEIAVLDVAAGLAFRLHDVVGSFGEVLDE